MAALKSARNWYFIFTFNERVFKPVEKIEGSDLSQTKNRMKWN